MRRRPISAIDSSSSKKVSADGSGRSRKLGYRSLGHCLMALMGKVAQQTDWPAPEPRVQKTTTMPEADGLGTSDKGKRNTASLPVAATGHLALGGVGRTDAARTQYEAADAAERSRKYVNTATIMTAKVVVISSSSWKW